MAIRQKRVRQVDLVDHETAKVKLYNGLEAGGRPKEIAVANERCVVLIMPTTTVRID